jgi:hypothetical protein
MEFVEDKSTINTLAVMGFRWEGSADFRIEYLYNSYGLSKDERTAAVSSTVSQHPHGDRNLKRLMHSGMELIGMHYAYSSLRIPDFLNQENNLFFRYAMSLTDSSSTFQIADDLAIGDAWTLFAQLGLNIGDNTQEFSALEQFHGLLGFKWSF